MLLFLFKQKFLHNKSNHFRGKRKIEKGMSEMRDKLTERQMMFSGTKAKEHLTH
jgi:hypothetical protein